MTPTSSPAVPYQTGLLAIDCGGGIYTGGVSVAVNGTPVPIISTGGTIGNGSCVNLMIRNNTAIIYQITYGGGFTACLTPPVYDEVRTINFNYNMSIGLYGGYDYLEQYWYSGSLISGTTKQTAIVNPAADLGNGCPIQDLDLVVRFYIQGGIVPSPTPTITPTNTGTPTLTPTNTQTPTLTPTNTQTPTPTDPRACRTYRITTTGGTGGSLYTYVDCNDGLTKNLLIPLFPYPPFNWCAKQNTLTYVSGDVVSITDIGTC
jgi:hypothetical protein